MFAIYKWKCAHLRKHWEITVWTWHAIFYPLPLDGPPAFGVLNYFFLNFFSVQLLPSWPSGNHAVDLLWSIVTPSPKMFQDSRCCWASCCSPCWCWGTCHASRGTLVTAPMSVSATGLPTHLCAGLSWNRIFQHILWWVWPCGRGGWPDPSLCLWSGRSTGFICVAK